MAEQLEKEKKARMAAEALEKKKSELSDHENKLKEASSMVDGAVNDLSGTVGAEFPITKTEAAANTA